MPPSNGRTPPPSGRTPPPYKHTLACPKSCFLLFSRLHSFDRTYNENYKVELSNLRNPRVSYRVDEVGIHIELMKYSRGLSRVAPFNCLPLVI